MILNDFGGFSDEVFARFQAQVVAGSYHEQRPTKDEHEQRNGGFVYFNYAFERYAGIAENEYCHDGEG